MGSNGRGSSMNIGSSSTHNSTSSSSSSSTRSICFVQRIEYQFSGSSVWPFALALGDLDNDQYGDCELAVGNVHGNLFIYKHSCEQPWKKSSNLGSIVCIGIGDVLNEGKNFLVTLSCEGWCHVFDVPSDSADNKAGSGTASSWTNSNPSNLFSSQNLNQSHSQPTEDLKAFYKQSDIGVNVKLLLLDDIDGDGKIELVVGHTDKFVKAYRWTPFPLPPPASSDQCNSSQDLSPDMPSGCVLVDSLRSTQNDTAHDNGGLSADTTSFPAEDENPLGGSHASGKFEPIYGWRLEHIIGTISVIFWNGQRHLAVAQRGNNYAILFVDRNASGDASKYEGKVHYQQITGGRARNAETNCGILGNIRGFGSNCIITDYIYHMTSAGIIAKLELPRPQMPDLSSSCEDIPSVSDPSKIYESTNFCIMSSSQITDEHEIRDLLLMDMFPLTCSGEGREEIVVCARNGMTYIIDHSKNVVKFPFQQDVLAFVAGDFSIRPNCKAPCLVYVTFHNKIMLYYDIKLPRLDSTSLIESMLKDEGVLQALDKLGIRDNPLEQKKLYHKLLYTNELENLQKERSRTSTLT